MKYYSVAEARDMPGLRVVLTQGAPGPWAEAIKSILNFKAIPFVPVAQIAGEANEDLQAWTGQTTAPVAVYNDEPVRYSWLDILMLSERLAPEPALLPADVEERALVTGLCREIAGEDGLGWNRRHFMLAPTGPEEEQPESFRRMAHKYGCTREALARAPGRIGEIFGYFTARLERQQSAGSDYIVGNSPTAVDFFLANFMGMFTPLPHEQVPMPQFLRDIYSNLPPELEPFMAPPLLAHRDMMYDRHIETPLDF